jgi:hypothetical protein
MNSLYVYNKVDAIGLDHMDMLAREANTVIMSCELDLGVRDVVDRCWEELRLIRVYTKRQVFLSSNGIPFFLSHWLTNTTERVSTQTLAKRSLSVATRRLKMCVIRSIALSRTASNMLWCGELLPNTFRKELA